ncbi:class I SAM-dependent methyltransferase [Aerolutibacter ruishenii]|uniref:Methyltransferase-like protein n=1 Tax=Aerolutibacter ruishenii TaxID=686800 RepID=A0A562LV83_9GAMM|nr:class I SAM-dependent methyltransferase [Lysobacter ruishenii]TWI11557.1 methyltransferase-like protein [Lysobacter ruishenii]
MATTIEQVRAYYNQFPYSSHAYPHSAPEQLQAIAHIFGHSAPSVGTARVLELGAAAGGNLIPAAIRNPGMRAVGVDLSDVQVEMARARAREVGLDNIEFIQADLAQLESEALGEFDYIICHGLYSWVPPQVQEAMLRIFGQNLASGGLAFVSYNTYPGWKGKEMIRDAMLLHASQCTSAVERIAHAKAMVGFLQQAVAPGSVMSAALTESAALIKGAGDQYLAHEYLEPYNLPCYFQDFVARAAEYGLAYLAEAEPSMMVPANYGANMANALSRTFGHDQVRMEQYLDFAVNRAFRQTILAKVTAGASKAFRMERTRLHSLHYSANLPCRSGSSTFDGTPQGYGAGRTPSLELTHGALKHAVDTLTDAWPGSVTRDELVERASTLSTGLAGMDLSQIPHAVDELLEYLVMRGLARIRMEAVPLAGAVPSRPTLEPSARRMLQTLEKGHSPDIANLWHESVDLTPAEHQVLSLLDGTHDVEALARLVSDHGDATPPVSETLEALRRKSLISR